MSQSLTKNSAPRLQTNPFSTRWVRPGAVPFLFSAGVSAEGLVEQLRLNNWRGVIVGPHGSGKSTLLATLMPAIEQTGLLVRRISLHNDQETLLDNFCWRKLDSQTLLVIDGFEQLPWLRRWRLIAAANYRRRAILATVHRRFAAMGLPVLYRTATDLATVQHLVGHDLPPSAEHILPDDVTAAFHANSGNVRETLFSLYDLFEQRCRQLLQSARF